MKQSSQLNLSQRTSMNTVQLMSILQMNHIELYAYINDMLQENPVLEAYEMSSVFHNSPYSGKAADRETTADALTLFASYEDHFSLYDHVRFHLNHLSGAERDCAFSMAACLDQNAILSEDCYKDLCSQYGTTLADATLARLQALEPAGIAARSIPERLILQMRRAGTSSPLAESILSRHLEHFIQHHYSKIASLTGADLEDVQFVCQQILDLDPFPFHAFFEDTQPQYIQPDVILDSDANLMMNDRWFPKLRLDPYYTQMLSDTEDRDVAEYLTARIRQASTLINSIAQRRNTILQCTAAIMEKQSDFFHSMGKAPLLPLTQSNIADAVGINVSTVSRAIKGKYLQCPFGLYELSYFFCSSVSAQAEQVVSSDHVKARIRALLSQEASHKPLSDQNLVSLLEQEGIYVARRTIAKYRGELGIPPASARKLKNKRPPP